MKKQDGDYKLGGGCGDSRFGRILAGLMLAVAWIFGR